MRPINQQTLKALLAVLSPERFGTYLTAAGHDPERALRLYLWNAQLGEAFHLPIQAVDVGLRNRINDALLRVYGADWWNSQAFLKDADKERTDDLSLVCRRLQRRKLALTTGQIVASLSFGFWVGMLQARYNPPIWGGQLRAAFPFLPSHQNRGDLAQRAGRIAKLRNRISHHEPLIGRNISADYSDVRTMVEWVCPTKWRWIAPHCRVPEIMRSKP